MKTLNSATIQVLRRFIPNSGVYYFSGGRVQIILGADLSVCESVRPSVRTHVSGTIELKFTNVHAACDRS